MLLIVSVSVAGCHRSAPAKRTRPLIGVTLLTETHAFYKELEDAMRKEAAADGLDLVIVACEMDPAKQASQIEDFVTERVDAILAAPCDSAAVVPYLAEAEQASIPVFTVDIAARGGNVVSAAPATTSKAAAWPRGRWRRSSAARATSSSSISPRSRPFKIARRDSRKR